MTPAAAVGRKESYRDGSREPVLLVVGDLVRLVPDARRVDTHGKRAGQSIADRGTGRVVRVYGCHLISVRWVSGKIQSYGSDALMKVGRV